jgi:hypothetical protein
VAIVKEYKSESGTRIQICDDAYAGCSPAEIRRREEEVRRTAWWCWARALERKKDREAR